MTYIVNNTTLNFVSSQFSILFVSEDWEKANKKPSKLHCSLLCCVLCFVAQSGLTLCNPARLLCPWGFLRQEYWSELPCPPPRDLLNQGMEPRSPKLC